MMHAGQRPLPGGVINAALPPYNADSSGTRDATAALQAAARDSSLSRQTLFIPAGRYRVTDTLNLTLTWPFGVNDTTHTDAGPPTPDYLFAATVMVGEQGPVRPDGRRPTTLFLPSNTPGFTSPESTKNLIHLFHAGQQVVL